MKVSIPFIAGQWSLHYRFIVWNKRRSLFQSPSLRGSGRFILIILLCGLVTALFQSPSLRGSGRFGPTPRSCAGGWKRFNPLHCGAVVASFFRFGTRLRFLVSIPFIAGQWSLRPRPTPPSSRACVFQSPSLRGSGRFSACRRRAGFRRKERFNPLHCGAVVASPRPPDRPRHRGRSFQSPSLRGSGRFPPLTRGRGPAPGSFNPLHCGAVVASRRPWGSPRRTAGRCFNPLHCGAVVASGSVRPYRRRGAMFQSPSLRGSGRFVRRCTRGGGDRRVSIPFIAGQWSLRFDIRLSPELLARVSIPFIAGQWSLPRRSAPS